MVDSRSDDELRQIVFGRGSSPEEVAAASAELGRRSVPADTGWPAVAERDPADDDVEPADSDPGVEDSSPDSRAHGGWRRTIVVAAAVAVLALAGGWAAHGLVADEVAPEMPSGSPGVGMQGSQPFSVVDSKSGAIVYTIPAGRPDYLSEASSDRFPEATETDEHATRLPSAFAGVDTTTARYIGRIGDLRGAWTARGTSGEYCVVLALNTFGAFNLSCNSVGGFADRGVYVEDGRYTLVWNAASAILSMTAD